VKIKRSDCNAFYAESGSVHALFTLQGCMILKRAWNWFFGVRREVRAKGNREEEGSGEWKWEMGGELSM